MEISPWIRCDKCKKIHIAIDFTPIKCSCGNVILIGE